MHRTDIPTFVLTTNCLTTGVLLPNIQKCGMPAGPVELHQTPEAFISTNCFSFLSPPGFAENPEELVDSFPLLNPIFAGNQSAVLASFRAPPGSFAPT